MFHLIVNRIRMNKKTRRKIEDAVQVFKDSGQEYEVRVAENKGDDTVIAREISLQPGEHCIVVLGGDGTLHDVINGIEDFEHTSMALIPLGTGNDFASIAKIPTKAKEAAEMILSTPPVPMDYIQLADGLKSINVVGMGIDVDVLERAYAGKRHGRSKYLFALIKSLIHFQSIHFTLDCEGHENEEHYGLIIAVGNGRQIGGGIKLFPEANLTDGWLDLLVVDYISRPKLIGAFIKLMRGKINKVKHTTHLRVKSARLIPQTENWTIQAEGEIYANRVIDARIVEGGLKFVLPPAQGTEGK
ncbi:MAG: YegS/Rv2252/BmrU family lipid kinase [Clostridia bacterium]|nr:YegS/Rv2252/BmrU family lipid kinase [Clostridia bacterium]